MKNKAPNTKRRTNKAFALYVVIARLFSRVGIILWFIICIFGWIAPIALQNDGYSNTTQIIVFFGWLAAIVIGVYELAKNTNFSFF